jgi:hypothetical protein
MLGHWYTLLLRTAVSAVAFVQVIRWQPPAEARIHTPATQWRSWRAPAEGRVWPAACESRTWVAPRVRQDHVPPAYPTHTEGTPP